ncbi:ABC transporter permease subunit [Clostridium sp.]|uniref:ABC transporter permease n=1 Tax=Clostridium sp. TaxID=1506 RepID=UPI002845A2F8|nr:ABC transporter permease subunit [Clostridium sp.]MDR3594528.1 ABC transporter permease subunit [Clostridium sp.]
MAQITRDDIVTTTIKRNKASLKTRMYKYRYFYLMFLPVFLAFLVFNYIPMVGILIAFFDWGLFGINEFVGLDNFKTLFQSTAFLRAFGNTLYISLMNLGLSMVCCVGLALLIDEIRGKNFKKLTQTVIYLPHFLSWVVVASVFSLILSPQDGIVNAFLGLFGIDPIYFLADTHWWTPVFLFIERWKGTGWGTIIFIAALSGVDPSMHEAATIDGATRLQRVLYITLPAIRNTILVVFILELAKVLNLFESPWVLQNAMVLDKADVIQTYVYRIGVENSDYGLSTAAGLFKSVISVILVIATNKISKKITGEGII